MRVQTRIDKKISYFKYKATLNKKYIDRKMDIIDKYVSIYNWIGVNCMGYYYLNMLIVVIGLQETLKGFLFLCCAPGMRTRYRVRVPSHEGSSSG